MPFRTRAFPERSTASEQNPQRGEAMSKRGGLGRGLAALIPTAPPVTEEPATSSGTPTPSVPGTGGPTVSLVPPPADLSLPAEDEAPAAARAAARASAANGAAA